MIEKRAYFWCVRDNLKIAIHARDEIIIWISWTSGRSVSRYVNPLSVTSWGNQNAMDSRVASADYSIRERLRLSVARKGDAHLLLNSRISTAMGLYPPMKIDIGSGTPGTCRANERQDTPRIFRSREYFSNNATRSAF